MSKTASARTSKAFPKAVTTNWALDAHRPQSVPRIYGREIFPKIAGPLAPVAEGKFDDRPCHVS